MHVDSLDEAYKFLNAYGFDDNEELEKLRNTALEYIDILLLKKTHESLRVRKTPG
jgi:predicted lactoylglutathione lyase